MGVFTRDKILPAEFEIPRGHTLDIVNLLKVELQHIIDDVLAPYKINDKLFNTSVILDPRFKWQQASITVRDVIYWYMLGEETSLTKVNYKGFDLVTTGGILDDVNNTLTFTENGNKTTLNILARAKVCGFDNKALKHSLLALFTLRQAIFEGLRKKSSISTLAVGKIKGYRDSIAAQRNNEQNIASINNAMIVQFRSILEGRGGFIDAEDDISLLTAGGTQSFREDIAFFYDELARILRIPVTVLKGDSPSGLNASGEYDYRRYAEYLDGVRIKCVTPLLDMLKIEYTLDYEVSIRSLRELIQLVQLTVDEKTKTLLQTEVDKAIERFTTSGALQRWRE